MNNFVIAVLLFAVGQVAAHGYSPYKKNEGDNFVLSNGDGKNDDSVDLGQLFNPDSETTTNSDENGKKGHGRPTLGIFWGRKMQKQHYRRNYQDMGDNEQNYQGGQRYPGQGVNFEQDWQRSGQQQQQHGGSGGYGLNYNEDGVGVKARQSYQDGSQYLNQHKIDPQDYHLGSATDQFLEREFLEQEQQTFGGGKKQRVFHPDELQEGGRFVVNQLRHRGNQDDSNESESVENKNAVRQLKPGYF